MAPIKSMLLRERRARAGSAPKERPQRLFKKDVGGLRYSEYVAGDGPRFRQHACQLGLEDAISKRADRPYAPSRRSFIFDDAAAKAIECALSRHAPAEALPQSPNL